MNREFILVSMRIFNSLHIKKIVLVILFFLVKKQCWSLIAFFYEKRRVGPTLCAVTRDPSEWCRVVKWTQGRAVGPNAYTSQLKLTAHS